MAEIVVPHGFSPRDYQKPLYNCLANGKKRAIAVWHRRAGKDKCFLAMLASAAFCRVGIYFYILPTYKQARKVIWSGMDSAGVPHLAVLPDEVIAHKNNQEMVLTLINGSLIYFLGSDNIDSIMGTNPVGIFFSEYSLHKPHVWDYLRPILLENGGFAVFNGTPRGKNHMYKMLVAAQNNPDEWFSEVLHVEETGVLTAEMIQHEIEVEGMDKATAKQEFYCSFDAALQGAYYDEAMMKMEADVRVRPLSIDTYKPVHVAWDLGMSDTMVLILFQVVDKDIYIVDLIFNNGKGLDWYANELKKTQYLLGTHYVPHDIRVRELSDAKTRLQSMYDLGLTDIRIAPKLPIVEGVNEVRKMLNRTYIDTRRCEKLVEALKAYRKVWDAENAVFKNQPLHDWASHFADSMRVLATGYNKEVDISELPTVAIGTGYDPIHKSSESYPYQQKPTKTNYGPDFSYRKTWDPKDYSVADGYYS